MQRNFIQNKLDSQSTASIINICTAGHKVEHTSFCGPVFGIGTNYAF